MKIADCNVALLEYHEAHPEVGNSLLGKLFGKSRKRVWQIIQRNKRDRMVVEYFRAHPEATPDEVRLIFHISLQRAQFLSGDPMCSQKHPELIRANRGQKRAIRRPGKR